MYICVDLFKKLLCLVPKIIEKYLLGNPWWCFFWTWAIAHEYTNLFWVPGVHDSGRAMFRRCMDGFTTIQGLLAAATEPQRVWCSSHFAAKETHRKSWSGLSSWEAESPTGTNHAMHDQSLLILGNEICWFFMNSCCKDFLDEILGHPWLSLSFEVKRFLDPQRYSSSIQGFPLGFLFPSVSPWSLWKWLSKWLIHRDVHCTRCNIDPKWAQPCHWRVCA